MILLLGVEERASYVTSNVWIISKILYLEEYIIKRVNCKQRRGLPKGNVLNPSDLGGVPSFNVIAETTHTSTWTSISLHKLHSRNLPIYYIQYTSSASDNRNTVIIWPKEILEERD